MNYNLYILTFSRFYQLTNIQSYTREETYLAGVLFVTPLATLRTSCDTAHCLAKTRIRQSREFRFLLSITRWQSRTRMILHNVRFTFTATFVNLERKIYNIYENMIILFLHAKIRIYCVIKPCRNTGSNSLWFAVE